MNDEPARDNTTFTAAQFYRRPRSMAIVTFFLVCLLIFRLWLVAIIKLNSLTVQDYEFHWWAIALLLKTRELLNNMGWR